MFPCAYELQKVKYPALTRSDQDDSLLLYSSLKRLLNPYKIFEAHCKKQLY